MSSSFPSAPLVRGVFIVLVVVALAAGGCSDPDEGCADYLAGTYPDRCLGPVPDSRLTNGKWLMVEARDAQGQPVEPVTQLLAQGVELPLSIRHGISSIRLCNGASAPQIYSPTSFTVDPRRMYPSTTVACDPVSTEAVRVLSLFFRPSVAWQLENSVPMQLTLRNPDGTTVRFVDGGP